MSIQQPSTWDNARPLHILDFDKVSEQKPDSPTNSGHSVIPWHDIATIFRLLLKTVSMPFKSSIFYIELTGVERNSSEKMTVVYIGDKSSYEYVNSCMFNAKPEVRCQRRIPWWSVNRQVKNTRKFADLLVGDIDFPLDFLVKKQGALILPRWLKQKIMIPDKWQDVLANLRRKTRREALRSIRKHNLKAHVVRDSSSDSYFYHKLYKPYIYKRYGAQAAVVDEHRFLKECASGQLIQVLQNDKVLGVVLVHISGKQLTIAWMGIDKDIEDNQLNGVTDALDLYSLMFAYSQGCDVMDMGGSRPLINDGVLRYKKKWGSTVSLGLIPKGSIFYIPCRISRPVESFLEKNPMIINDRNKLRCVSWDFATKDSGADADTVVSDDEINLLTDRLNMMYVPGLKEFQCFQIINEDEQQYEYTGIVAGLPYRISRISCSKITTVLSEKINIL